MTVHECHSGAIPIAQNALDRGSDQVSDPGAVGPRPLDDRGILGPGGRGMAASVQQTFEEGQRATLELMARGRPLAKVLEEIVLLVERQAERMFCSILLLDRESGTVRHGAAPHLPAALITGIDGAPIGPTAGSCGAAAYLGEPVVVEDIGTHPNWVDYRQLVLPAGLRACWSSPIFSHSGGDVLGTFAMYYREPRRPTEQERLWVSRATHLAAIAISRDRAEQAVRQSDARYRQIVNTAYEGVWLIDTEARTLLVNDRTAKLLGLVADDLLGRKLVDFMDEPSREVAEGTFIQRVRTVSDQHQFRFRRKDGSHFWALISGSPIRDDKGHPSGALCMITDITELKVTEQALRQSEAEFRVVFENAGIGMALAGRDGNVLRSNPALQRFLGYSEGELRGRQFSDFTHPDDLPADRELFDRMTTGEVESYQNERRYLRKDGSVVWGRLTASLVRPEKGKPMLAIGMIENVSERRRMEEAVRSSERLRSLIYDSVTDVLFYIGVEAQNRYRFLSVNQAFLRETGLEENQVVNRLIDEVIPQPAAELVMGHYARAIEERRTVTWDEVTSYPAGVKYGEVSITPLFDADGRCRHLIGTVHDVTERRRAQERMATQATMLDRAKDAIILRDVDGLIQHWNKGAQRLYGWSVEEAIGRNVVDLIYKDSSAFQQAREQLLEQGEWSGEVAHVNKAGKSLIVEGSWTLVRDEQGQPHSVVGIHTDVTEKRRLEAQVIRAQRLDSLGIQAAGIAHDFNNLLMVIGEGLRLAQADLPPNHPACESLKAVENATHHGASLTRQMLTFSGRQESIRKLVKLDRVVADPLGLLRATLPRTVLIETDMDAQAPEILADATQIQQIVMNLANNAAHAMKGSGTLEVRVESVALDRAMTTESVVLAAGSYARLVVSDTGRGMDEATREHIFDPLFTTKPAGEGTGLGLSVVHGIVKSHQGGIIVRSAPGRGTEFSLYFPAAQRARGQRGVGGPSSPVDNPPGIDR
jgi:PAS domain S-box-containing protein